jgi:hypothetical protein
MVSFCHIFVSLWPALDLLSFAVLFARAQREEQLMSGSVHDVFDDCVIVP